MKLYPSFNETIAGTTEAIRAHQRTCLDVLEVCLTRIDERESEVRAWVLIDRDGARRRTRELDADSAAGRWHGPLHGIPIAIKDIVDVAGWPTAAGSKLLGREPAAKDAPIVTHLRKAGAVFIGKTVTTQYASFDPPVTRNPWNLERTPGGSSSGSAAGLACGMCLGAVGSQTGGSITRPASYCGVAGLKPTYGRLCLDGFFPLAPSMDHPGPIARTVRDLEILFGVMAGSGDVEKGGRGDTEIGRPRLGRLRGHFHDKADATVRTAMDDVVRRLGTSGATITEPPLPASFADVVRSHRVIMATESAAYHEHRLAKHPDDYLPRITDLLKEGLAAPATEYIRCRQHQSRLSQEMLTCFDGVDALLAPATTSPAPDRSTTGDPAFQSPWSYTGLPTISFPVALSSDGLPICVQLAGRPNSEENLFQVAAWCEDRCRRTMDL